MKLENGKLYMFQDGSYLFKSRDCVSETDDDLCIVDNQIVMILEQYSMKYGLHGFRLLTSEGLVGYICVAERFLEKTFVKL
jgi:hypothetical protein